MDNETKEKVAAAMVKRRAAQFAFLKDLIGINTTPAEADMGRAAEKIAAKIEAIGFDVERHQAPADAAGSGIVNLVVRGKFGDGPTLAMVTHLDTTVAGEGWSVGPRAGHIKDGQMFGRGTLSGKSDLAAQIFSILALADAGVAVNGTVEFHISFDGERGGRAGCRWLLADGIVAPDMAIANGPARAIAVAATGSMVMDIEVRGQPAPAFAPENGRDALEAATHALSRLFQFRGGLKAQVSDIPGIGAPHLVVDEIAGGGAGMGVPGVVKFSLERRLNPEEDPARVENQLTNLIGATVARSAGVRCRIRRSRLIPPMTGGDKVARLQAVISEHLYDKTGISPPARGLAFENEGRHYAANGIPCVMYGAGPAEPLQHGLHGVDEHVILDDVRLGTEVLARTVLSMFERR